MNTPPAETVKNRIKKTYITETSLKLNLRTGDCGKNEKDRCN
jgi:hypothetical protein